jgi:prevent-host-death family protein
MCYVVYMSGWAKVSVRELRQNLSRYLRRVEAGETLEVLSRGRAVARLAPLPGHADPVVRLVSEGRARPPRSDLRALEPPLPAGSGISISEALAEQRAERL